MHANTSNISEGFLHNWIYTPQLLLSSVSSVPITSNARHRHVATHIHELAPESRHPTAHDCTPYRYNSALYNLIGYLFTPRYLCGPLLVIAHQSVMYSRNIAPLYLLKMATTTKYYIEHGRLILRPSLHLIRLSINRLQTAASSVTTRERAILP